MKKLIISSVIVVTIFALLLSTGLTGCTKETTTTVTTTVRDTITKRDTVCISNIQGLWEGTFTTVSGYSTVGSSYYFSLSIYPNGTCSYKSGTASVTAIVYAAGTWSLVNNILSFNCRTLNSPGGVDVIGSATYNKSLSTLSNGTTSTMSPLTTATWRMSKTN